MDEKIKDIVSLFVKILPEKINQSTLIDRSAVNNSILLHRMYAKLAEQGIVIENHSAIRSFGELMQIVQKGNEVNNDLPRSSQNEIIEYQDRDAESAIFAIGIDIESIAYMPVTDDFREDEFYKMNFTAAETAYCILQPDPYASFAGLFAAKEAIVKADNSYRNKSFNSISINHLPQGKPVHNEFHISISHAKDLAVAVAVKNNMDARQDHSPIILPGESIVPVPGWIGIVSLLLSLIALIIVLLR